MFVFSDDVHHLLTVAGWFPGRTVDTVLYRQQARLLKLGWLPAAESFLREFGGLHCFFPRLDLSISPIFFEVERATACLSLDRLHDDFVKRVPGGELCVVGQAYSDPLCLLMDSQGTLYGACEADIYRIAPTGKAGIEAIILDQPFEEVAALSSRF